IEDQHWRNKVICRAPEFEVGAMQIFPQGLAIGERRMIDPLRSQLSPKRLRRLLDQLSVSTSGVDADVDGEPVLRPKAGSETGEQQRSLAEAGRAEQHCQWHIVDEAEEIRGFLLPAVEKVFAILIEFVKSRPRVLGVGNEAVQGGQVVQSGLRRRTWRSDSTT